MEKVRGKTSNSIDFYLHKADQKFDNDYNITIVSGYTVQYRFPIAKSVVNFAYILLRTILCRLFLPASSSVFPFRKVSVS